MFSTPQNNLNVIAVGATTPKVVGTSAVQLDTVALDSREGVILWANKRVFIAFSNSVTTTTFVIRMEKNEGIKIIANSDIQIWAISDSVSAGPNDITITPYK